MKSILACLLTLGAAAAALSDPSTSPLPGEEREVVPLQWTGQVEIGKKNITLEGTAEEIYNQILAINPNYDEELGIKNWKELAATTPAKRADPINSNSINCNVGAGCEPLWVLNGISNLYAIGNGGCTAPAGWGGCARTQCYSGSAIFLCNDHPTSITVPCRLVADNAQGVHNQCKHWYYDPPAPRRAGGTYDYLSNGQIFSFDGKWNVIVKSDRC